VIQNVKNFNVHRVYNRGIGVEYNLSHSVHADATWLKLLMIVRLSKLEISSENTSTVKCVTLNMYDM